MIKKIVVILIGFTFIAFQIDNGLDEYKTEARKVVKSFGSSLKKELVKGLKEGGAIKALEVCNLKASDIASEISDKSGWKVSRTALKTRNENNSPDAWELSVLNKFEEMKAGGATIKELEYAEIITDDSMKVFRYMKAIPTGGLCLQCHGDKLKSDVQQLIKKLYPRDKAIGFKKGDIRGAFTLQKILK